MLVLDQDSLDCPVFVELQGLENNHFHFHSLSCQCRKNIDCLGFVLCKLGFD